MTTTDRNDRMIEHELIQSDNDDRQLAVLCDEDLPLIHPDADTPSALFMT